MSLSWLPNAISLLRIALVAPILILILQGDFGWALALFVIAGFSDGLDGYLAVRFDWSTRLGGLLDPAADKLLITGMFPKHRILMEKIVSKTSSANCS